MDGIRKEARQIGQSIVYGRVEDVRAALDAGFDLCEEVQPSRMLLHFAAEMDQYEICKMLIERGADVNAQRAFGSKEEYDLGDSPLHLAAKGGLIAVTQLLLEHGADPNAVTHHGATPLHFITGNLGHHYSWAIVTKLLLTFGADPNVMMERASDPRHWGNKTHRLSQPKYGKYNLFLTPLHEALELSAQIHASRREQAQDGAYEGYRVVKYLLDHGADPFVLPPDATEIYLTPLQYAIKRAPEADVRLLMALDGVDLALAQRTVAGRSMTQLCSTRPEIKSIVMSAKTTQLVRESVGIGDPDKVEPQMVRKAKGMGPL